MVHSHGQNIFDDNRYGYIYIYIFIYIYIYIQIVYISIVYENIYSSTNKYDLYNCLLALE